MLHSFARIGMFAALLLSLPACAVAGLFTEPDPNWREDSVEYPPPPNEDELHGFFVTAASPHRFFVDEASLSVGEDRVVRYTLVVRTAGGSETITFEGIRCETGERRIYAHWRPEGEWSPARRSEWEALRASGYNMPRAVLAAQHFCDGPAPPRSVDEARRRLIYGLGQ
ncbi:MAG: CNP1-like family protein [Azoarcus sp.]|nr:CNP1-like family protein [Azoarcus sp.]